MRIDYAYIFYKFGEDMCYQTQILFIFVISFADIGQCFRPAQTKNLENQKSGHIRMILSSIYGNFSPFRPNTTKHPDTIYFFLFENCKNSRYISL